VVQHQSLRWYEASRLQTPALPSSQPCLPFWLPKLSKLTLKLPTEGEGGKKKTEKATSKTHENPSCNSIFAIHQNEIESITTRNKSDWKAPQKRDERGRVSKRTKAGERESERRRDANREAEPRHIPRVWGQIWHLDTEPLTTVDLRFSRSQSRSRLPHQTRVS
jgi:hypothetical protein